MEKSQPGVLISLFIVPPSTPIWLWATVSAAFLLVLNCYLLFRLKRKLLASVRSDSGAHLWVAWEFSSCCLNCSPASCTDEGHLPWLRAWNHTTLKIAYGPKLQRRMAALGILPCGSHLRPPRPLRSRYS